MFESSSEGLFYALSAVKPNSVRQRRATCLSDDYDLFLSQNERLAKNQDILPFFSTISPVFYGKVGLNCARKEIMSHLQHV